MPEENIVQTIRLEGGAEVERRFQTLGAAGREAFETLVNATKNLDFSAVEKDIFRAAEAIDTLHENVAELEQQAARTEVTNLSDDVKVLGEESERTTDHVKALNDNVKRVDAAPVEQATGVFGRLRKSISDVVTNAKELPGVLGDIADSSRGLLAALAAGAGLAAIGAGFVFAFRLAKQAAETMDELRIAANKLGVESTEELQKFRFVLGQLGVDGKDADKVIKTFGERAEEAAKKGEAEFKKLGITFGVGAEKAEIIGRAMVSLASQGLGAKRGFTELDGIIAQFGGRLNTEKLQKLADLISKITSRDPNVSNAEAQQDVVSKIFGDIKDIELFTEKLAAAGTKTTEVVNNFSQLRSGIVFGDLASETQDFVDSLKSISDETVRAKALAAAFGPELADKIKQGTASAQELQLKFIDLRQGFDRASSVNFEQVIRQIAAIEDPIERTRVAVSLLGEQLGRRLVTDLTAAGGGIDKIISRFDNLNLAIPEEQIAESSRLLFEFRTALREFLEVATGGVNPLGVLFAPLLGPAATGLRALSDLLAANTVRLRAWISELSGNVTSAIKDFVNLFTRSILELRETGDGEFSLEPKITNAWVRTFTEGIRLVIDGLKALRDAATSVSDSIASAFGFRIDPIFATLVFTISQVIGGFKALAVVAAGLFVSSSPAAVRFRDALKAIGIDIDFLSNLLSDFLSKTWADFLAAISGRDVQQQWVKDLIEGIKEIAPIVLAVLGVFALFRRELAAISVAGIFNRLTGAFSAIAALAVTLSFAIRGVASAFATLASFAGAPVAIATGLAILLANFDLLRLALEPISALLNRLFGVDFFNGIRLARIAIIGLTTLLATSLVTALGVVSIAARRAFGIIGFLAGVALTQMDRFRDKSTEAGSALDLLGKDIGDRVRAIVSGLDQTNAAADRTAQGINRASRGIIDVQTSLRDVSRRQALGIVDVPQKFKEAEQAAKQTGATISSVFDNATAEFDEFRDNLDQQGQGFTNLENDVQAVGEAIVKMATDGIANLPNLEKVAKEALAAFDDRGIKGVIDVLQRDLSNFEIKFDQDRLLNTLKQVGTGFKFILGEAFDPAFVLERFKSLFDQISTSITSIDLGAAFRSWLERVWDNDIVLSRVKELNTSIFEIVSGAFDQIRSEQTIWADIVANAQTAFANLQTTVLQAFQSLGPSIQAIIGSLTSFFEPVTAAWRAAIDSFVTAAQTRLQQLKSIIDQLRQSLFGASTAIQGAEGGGFAEGGWTGNIARHRIAGVVHGQEYVEPAWVVARPGVLGFLEHLRISGGDLRSTIERFARGFSLGGFVQNVSTAMIVPPLPLPGFQRGGLVPPPAPAAASNRHLGTIDLRAEDGRTFRIMTDRETAEGLTRYAAAATYRKAAPSPSWDR